MWKARSGCSLSPYRGPMLRRPTLITVAIALVVTLTACTESARIPDAEPSPEVTPLFASDEEALAAATAAYEEYLAASNLVTASQDLNLGPIEPLVSAAFLEDERDAIKPFELNGFRSQGSSLVVNALLQQWLEESDDQTVVLIYVCVDVSGVKLIDSSGNDVTPKDRPSVVPLEVEMIEDPTASGRLLLNQSSTWEGTTVCD